MKKILLTGFYLPGNREETSNMLVEESENGYLCYWKSSPSPDYFTKEDDCAVLDLGGRTLSFGLVDLHVHFRDPGFTYKETIETGTAAARAGGFSVVCTMPNTNPVADNPETVEYIISEAKKYNNCLIHPIASITKGLEGKELTDMTAFDGLWTAGFSDDGRPVQDCAVMRKAMQKAAENDYIIFSHSEELSLTEGKTVINENIGRKLGLCRDDGVPASAEVIGITKDILLAEETGCRLHICHVSAAGGVQAVREAKARGVRVTAETAPHYIFFTEEDVERLGTRGKMNPPLRSGADRDALIEGIKDGTIDCIATDHAPHSAEEKAKDFAEAPCGIIGLESSFAACYTALVKPGHISLEKLLDLMSKNPMEIATRAVFYSSPLFSDMFTVIDESYERVFSEDEIKSKSKCSPFIGETLFAKAEILTDYINRNLKK